MVNNYPEYAAGVNFKKTDSNGVRHFYSAQVVTDPSDETIESKLIKDGVVISEGGGSSDFSTAEVTVVNNTEEHIDGKYVSVVDTPISTVRPMNTLSFNSSRTYIVPLYKGSCYWVFDGTANVSVSGDIEWNSEDRTAFITGDCTITVSAV